VSTLLDTDAVSARLGRPKETLRYWRGIGYGPPSFKVGRKVMYREDKLETWLAEQEAASTR
jgi:Helix-turn-helix domain